MPTLTRMLHHAPTSAAAVRRLPASWKMAASGGRAFSKTTPLRLAAVADAGMNWNYYVSSFSYYFTAYYRLHIYISDCSHADNADNLVHLVSNMLLS
jgi:hypothetical protein